jgi:hypothetical protein
MTIAMRAGVAAIAAVALGIGLSGCGSDSSSEKTTTGEASAASESAPSSAAPTSAAPTPTPAAGSGMTIDQYVEENGIVATPVRKGDPGAPTITLPIPDGWAEAGPDGPAGAYDALVYSAAPPAPNPPTIVAVVTKLTGDVDPAKIAEYAPNEMRNRPGFEGPEAGQTSDLAGFEATQIGGFYSQDGVQRLIAQKTVIIPGQDGLFVLKITADGGEDLAMQMMEATAAIDEQTTIVP